MFAIKFPVLECPLQCYTDSRPFNTCTPSAATKPYPLPLLGNPCLSVDLPSPRSLSHQTTTCHLFPLQTTHLIALQPLIPAMPSDDYAYSGGGGALKLKGAKVDKKKKKKRSAKTDLEKNLSTGDNDSSASKEVTPRKQGSEEAEDKREDEDDVAAPQKTESERQYEEAKKKKVSETAVRDMGHPRLSAPPDLAMTSSLHSVEIMY